MKKNISKDTKSMIELELRKGTSNSRIANILGVSYEEALEVIGAIKDSVRPEIGDEIRFTFRKQTMVGVIRKLLTNSAVVEIYWDLSSNAMKDICEDRTIVNFKDIEEFVSVR